MKKKESLKWLIGLCFVNIVLIILLISTQNKNNNRVISPEKFGYKVWNDGKVVVKEYSTSSNEFVDYPADSIEDAHEHKEEFEDEIFAVPVFQNTVLLNERPTIGDDDRYLKVHFIDVGQGDCILVESAGVTMLMDAGDNEHGQKVVSYLKSHSIEQLDLVIATHPHVDHIGGMDDVLANIKVKRIILPDVSYSSASFQKFIAMAVERKIPFIRPNIGDTYVIGNAKFKIVAPNSAEYEAINDYSVGIRLEYGKRSFLLCGDAHKNSEEQMCENGIPLKSDVLKINHHGSKTSTCDRFLREVNPKFAVISVEKGNDYGHPYGKVLKRLKDHRITILRTDQNGTIVAITDGETITMQTER